VFVRILPPFVGPGWLLVELPGRGLEPLRISPPDPKSGASANFATLANTFTHDSYAEMSCWLKFVIDMMLTAWDHFRMKKPILKVRRYRHSQTHKFLLDLRAFDKGRKFFKTRAEADAECLRQKTLLERHSRAAVGLSQRAMSE